MSQEKIISNKINPVRDRGRRPRPSSNGVNIAGFQKLSLVDYPGKICSIVFTQGCLFRCSYCHNPELVSIQNTSAIHPQYVLECLQDRKEFIDGVCITGGEPTLHPGLPQFMKEIRALGLLVKLDTSGVNPAMVKHVINEGLVDFFAMDIKHRWEKYQDVVQTKNTQAMKNCPLTFRIIQSSGIDHEFRTTVFPQIHMEDDFIAIASYLKPGEKYYIQNIQYKKTLDPDIDKTKQLDVGGLVKKLQKEYPNLIIQER